MSIYNQLGQPVLSAAKTTNEIGNWNEVLDISNFPSGVYNVVVKYGDNIFREKLVVR